MIEPRVGDRISEYLLDEMIGRGSFGQVWKAHHHIWHDQLAAIKVPTDSQYVRNLQREGVTIHGLRHPNIVRAIGLDPYGEVPYLIMEFVDGSALKDLVDAHPDGMPVQTARRIFCGILHALDHAHANRVIHRDIKPANILIASGGKKPIDAIAIEDVKVTDFGLGHAGQVTTESILQSGSLMAEDGRSISGTLAYMAPEQRDTGKTDERSDLYAVGIVLFEMLTGERPSGSDMPSHIREGLPAWADAVFSRLYTRWERRFANAAEVLKVVSSTEAPPVITSPRGGALGGASPQKPRDGNPRAASARPSHGTIDKCPKCHHAVEAGDNFCIACGEFLVSKPRKCLACGAFPEPDDRYCIRCGTAFAGSVG